MAEMKLLLVLFLLLFLSVASVFSLLLSMTERKAFRMIACKR